MAVTTYITFAGKQVTIEGLGERVDRIFLGTPAEGYKVPVAIKKVGEAKNQLLKQIKLVVKYEWKADAAGDETGVAARVAKIEQQVKLAITGMQGEIQRQAAIIYQGASALSTGYILEQQSITRQQIELDGADLIWCCLMDEIEAIHYDLICDYGEDACLGDAILHSNGAGGADVTVWEYVAMLEAAYKNLQDVKLVATLNTSRVPVDQRRPMLTGHDDVIHDFQLGVTYNI